MSTLDLVLAVVAALAAAGAAACLVAYRRMDADLRAQRATLRGALDVAGTETLEGVVEALIDARRRTEAVAALAPAVDELAERHRRIADAVNARDAVGTAAQDALKTALAEQGSASGAVGDLTGAVVQAGATVEETVTAISMVSGNITGLADNVSNVSSAIGELAVSVNQVAGSAREASTLSLEADRKAKDGGVAVERLVRSTREVADDITSVVAKMQELGSASERIGAIVEVIDAIADQTNLLALNAAIEAARAGEHGRGFAVVADEVRKLAESSAQSTREIASLVKDIQAKTGEVVKSTSSSGAKAESGLQMADVAGRAIGDISSAVGEANRLIEQISMAAREQASGASAIVNSVEQMNNLMRDAVRSLDEQNVANHQIVDIMATIQRSAGGVEAAIARQRAACDDLLNASKSLAAASRATKDATAGVDGIAETVRDRVRAISAGAPGAIAPQSDVARLIGGR
ncbi:MAG TPA: methyl-accepting chemotaxis protein [Candidatus Elarobacter sp.]|jgi:methyl-accepting chemotaxis protein|nr:methyl-accepting chemotaxis protein [Candidatus Elarobacter sp.]